MVVTTIPVHLSQCPPLTTMLAMASNQPGQNGGNQGPIFSVHIAALSTHEMKDPSNALASRSLDRLMHALYPANFSIVVNRRLHSKRSLEAARIFPDLY